MELFKNFNIKKPEEQRWRYWGDVVVVEKFDKTSKDRPKSAEFQEAYPELYDYLMKKDGAKEFNVGLIHIDGGGYISTQFVQRELSKYDKDTLKSEEKQREILRKLFIDLQDYLEKGVRSDFEDMARQIIVDSTGDLSKIEYFTAYSVLANKKNVASKLGFEIFEIDNEDEKKWNVEGDNSNNKQRNMVKEMISKFITIKYLYQPPKIALLSRDSLLKLNSTNLES